MMLVLAAGFLKHHHHFSQYDDFASLPLLPGSNKLIYVSLTLVYLIFASGRLRTTRPHFVLRPCSHHLRVKG